MPSCAIITCRVRSSTSNVSKNGVSFHRFPKDPNIKEKWIDATGRDNWFPTRSSTICSKHFKDNDYVIKKSGYKYLKLGAFPSIRVVSCRSFPCDHDQLDPLKSVTGCNATQSELADNVSKRIKVEQQEEYESIIVVDSYGDIKIEKREQDSNTSDLDNDSKQLQSPVSFDPLAIPSSSTKVDISSGKPILMDEQSTVSSGSGSNASTPRERKLEEIIAYKDSVIERQRKQIKSLQGQNRRLRKKINKTEGVLNVTQ